jgi:hypothetical protein
VELGRRGGDMSAESRGGFIGRLHIGRRWIHPSATDEGTEV